MKASIWKLMVGTLVISWLLGGAVLAQDDPIVADRDKIEIVGTLGGGALSGSLLLSAQGNVGDLSVLVSDLADASGAGAPRDPIAAAVITIVPAARWQEVKAGESVQVALQVAPPATTGTWSGRLTVRWRKPTPGELRLPVTLTARSRPALSLAAPPSVKVSAERGATVARTVLLQETANGSPATGLRLVAEDLTNTQGTAVLLADRLTAALPASEVAGGGYLTVSLRLDLREVPSGDYSGNLYVTDDYHNQVTIPLQVSVKDPAWPWPVGILVLGVVMGLSLTAYRAVGRPRDRLVVRIAEVRRQVAQETQYQSVLKKAVEKHLADTEAAVAGERWEEGNQAAQRAEALVIRWRKERVEWIQQLDSMKALQRRLDAVDAGLPDATAIRHWKKQLDQVDLEDFDTAEALQNELATLDARLRRFEQLGERLHALRKALDQAVNQHQLPQSASADWQNQLDDLARRLTDLGADQDSEAQTLANDLVDAGRRLTADLERYRQLLERREECLAAAHEWLGELGQPGSPTVSIAKAAGRARDRANKQADWAIAADWAENVWRGVWSARTILPLAGETPDEPVSTVAGALHDWLSGMNSYLQPTDDFRSVLIERETALRDALAQGGQPVPWPDEPVPPAAAVAKRIPADMTALEGELPLANLPVPWRSGGAASLLAAALDWLRQRAGLSQLRLWLFSAGVYLVLVVALSWLGFNQLYAASATFGANAPVDYFGLLMWGLGVEVITRSAVLDTLKGLLANS